LYGGPNRLRSYSDQYFHSQTPPLHWTGQWAVDTTTAPSPLTHSFSLFLFAAGRRRKKQAKMTMTDVIRKLQSLAATGGRLQQRRERMGLLGSENKGSKSRGTNQIVSFKTVIRPFCDLLRPFTICFSAFFLPLAFFLLGYPCDSPGAWAIVAFGESCCILCSLLLPSALLFWILTPGTYGGIVCRVDVMGGRCLLTLFLLRRFLCCHSRRLQVCMSACLHTGT
jgi:hypothetical protein